MASAPPLSPNTHGNLVNALTNAPQNFLQPSLSLHTSAIALAKSLLDPLTSEISAVQLERQRQNRKRKRHERTEDEDPLRLKQIYTEGLEVAQVWEQVRRAVDASSHELERYLRSLQDTKQDRASKAESNGDHRSKLVRFEEEEDEEVDSEQSSDAMIVDQEEDFEDIEEEDEAQDEVDDVEDGEEIDMDADDFEDAEYDDEAFESNSEFVEDAHGLNDGFFSIDNFNRQSQFLEQIDARGDPDDGAASDEEDVDWAIDPFVGNPMPGAIASGKTMSDSDVEESDSEDEGPTFGNMDLNAPEGASDEEDGADGDEELDFDDAGDLSNANNIMYKDFFAPPPTKASKRKGKSMPHNFPSKSPVTGDELQTDEDDVERTIATVHRDIFSDEEDEDAEDEEHLDPGDPKSRRSTHERRQAALLSEIRKLEAQNVAKRNWTLSGEARAAERPINSLLEEDLDFERTGKPVPVITTEVSEDIEALIRRRILSHAFDEVLRRRPDELLTGAPVRRGALPPVDDSKSTKGLAELYDEEYRRAADPNYVDPRDDRLRKEHAEIERAWKDVAARLDALCSWHYRPRPAEAAVQVRADAPAVALEDARPSGVGGVGVGEAAQLAPQEIYRAGLARAKDEVVTVGGEVVKKDELSREQKLRMRRRAKERLRKATGNAKPAPAPSTGTKAREKKSDVVAGLKKGGVTVIGRKGELLDVEGNAAKGKTAIVTGGSLKL